MNPQGKNRGDCIAAQDRPAEYLTPWRHVIDLLEAADALVATAANTAALFDDDLEADCDAAHRQIEQATETAYRDAEAQRAS